MSTFGGKIREIPFISIDRFDGDDNMESEVYFLSHCHTDHMRGLSCYYFQNQLVENNKFLYASQISCIILEKMYPYIKNNLRELALSTSTIFLKDKTLSVTTIPAGHCPGSIMFLFEGEKNILYTGDYRIRKNDIKKFKLFYNSSNKVKLIDKIYLDTTFFLKSYLNFPKRNQSLEELCNIITNWTERGKKFVINLATSAHYGYECAFKEVYKEVKMPVHVNQRAYDFYCLIPDMDNCVTLNGSITQVHSGCGQSLRTICDFGFDRYIKIIKLSALRWTQNDLIDGISSNETDWGIHYVCYSTHASYEEGVEFIRFLKPKEIEICVKHDDPYVNREMKDSIDEILNELHKTDDALASTRLFQIKGEVKTETLPTNVEAIDDFGILSSPPRERRNINHTCISPESKCKALEHDKRVNNIIANISPTQNLESVNEIKISSRAMVVESNSNTENVLLDIMELASSEEESKQSLAESKQVTASCMKSTQEESEVRWCHSLEDSSVLMSIIDSPSEATIKSITVERCSEEIYHDVLLDIIDFSPTTN